MTRRSLSILLVSVGIQLMTAGCFGVGSGVSDVFSSAFAALFGEGYRGEEEFSGGGSSGTSTQEVASVPGGASEATPSVATIHQPEPTSVVLFGGGLATLALSRRRKRRRQSS